MLCHFFAMLGEALTEREMRASLKAADLTGIPLYPELRNCPAPSAPRILEIFGGIQRHCLVRDGNAIQVFEPELSPCSTKSSISSTSLPTSLLLHVAPKGGLNRPREVRNCRPTGSRDGEYMISTVG